MEEEERKKAPSFTIKPRNKPQTNKTERTNARHKTPHKINTHAHTHPNTTKLHKDDYSQTDKILHQNSVLPEAQRVADTEAMQRHDRPGAKRFPQQSDLQTVVQTGRQ